MKKYSKTLVSRFEESLIDPEDLNSLLKFHNKTTWDFVNELYLLDWEEDYYAEVAPFVNNMPEEYTEEIKLKNINFNPEGSVRNFKKDMRISFEEFSHIVINSFGRGENYKKNYPSAGGLYPIIPLIYIFSDKVIEKIDKPGIYTVNSNENSVVLFRELSAEDILNVKENISNYGEILSDVLFAYAMDINKSIAKYKLRGYRHALIEVGSMVQNTRIQLQNRGMYEVCWSGFNDLKLSHASHMNPRLAPIVMMQWWGYSDTQ